MQRDERFNFRGATPIGFSMKAQLYIHDSICFLVTVKVSVSSYPLLDQAASPGSIHQMLSYRTPTAAGSLG